MDNINPYHEQNVEGQLNFICPACKVQWGNLPVGNKWSCPSCGKVYGRREGIPSLIAEVSNDNLQEAYEQEASSEKDMSQIVGYASKGHHRTMSKGFRKVVGILPPPRQILDLGCGHGLLAKEAGLLDFDVVGVDFSFNMLKRAQRNDLQVYQADALALPFAHGQFDMAICAEMIQHFDDAKGVLFELARVVRKGGHVAISTVNAQSWIRRLNRVLRPRKRSLCAVHRPKLRSLTEIRAVATHLPLDLKTVLLTYFPLRTIRMLTKPNQLNLRLSSNFIALFEVRA